MVGKIPFVTETSSYNELDVWLESKPIRFADRTQLGRAVGVLGDGIQVQNVLPRVQVWFAANKGMLDRDKG